MNNVSLQDMNQLKEAFKKDVANNSAIFGSGVSDWYLVAMGWAAGKDLSVAESKAFAQQIKLEMPSS